ncbi:MAG TPA: TRAM domain-containing protein [Kofleriaceae bacterium]|nr:TRAM domain-containing protein [Kofleriaceae bacterium]
MSEVELEVTALAAGGDGVARDEQGRVTFIPRTAVGDVVRVQFVEEKKRFARGEVFGIVKPSRDRVEPPCPFFKMGCGGCQWQHISREGQLVAKQTIVEGALRKLPGLVVEKIADPSPPYGWRRRARFHVVNGQVGLFAYATNQLLPIDRCPQLEPQLDDALRAAIAEEPVDGELHLLLGHDGTVAVTVGDAAVDVGRAAAETIARAAGDIATAAADQVIEAARAASKAAATGLAASEVIEIEPGLQGRAVDFAQASRAGNSALISITRAALGKGPGKLLELYAGAGNLTRAFLEDGWSIVASDVVAPAKVREGVRFELGNARDVTQRLTKRKNTAFDAVVLDPPRTGAAEAIESIAQLEPKTIVYVSCDPATLARDAQTLVDAGYRAERAWPIDMMPQTAHVEVVMKLTRA